VSVLDHSCDLSVLSDLVPKLPWTAGLSDPRGRVCRPATLRSARAQTSGGGSRSARCPPRKYGVERYTHRSGPGNPGTRSKVTHPVPEGQNGGRRPARLGFGSRSNLPGHRGRNSPSRHRRRRRDAENGSLDAKGRPENRAGPSRSA